MADEVETLNQPVTRREFEAAFDKLTSKIDELNRSRQFSWPVVISIVVPVCCALAFSVRNFTDVENLKVASALVSGSTSDFRERIRALEANHHAAVVENETQNRWMADVVNLEVQYVETLLRMKHPDIPPRTYWPMARIGGVAPTPSQQ